MVVKRNMSDDGSVEFVAFSDSLMRRDHLYVGGEGTGRSTLAGHSLRYVLQEKADGRWDGAVVVIEPDRAVMSNILRNTPMELVRAVRLVDFADPDQIPVINPLDVHVFRDREVVTGAIVRSWDLAGAEWKIREQHLLAQSLRSLYECNKNLDRESQHTLEGLLSLLSEDGFRESVLERVEDADLRNWWESVYMKVASGERNRLNDTVLGFLEKHITTLHGFGVLMSSRCMPDIRETIEAGGVVLVCASDEEMGAVASKLVTNVVLALLTSMVHEPDQAAGVRGMCVVVDDMDMFDADFGRLMFGNANLGGNVIFTCRDMSVLDLREPGMKDKVLASVGCVCVFE